MLGDLKAGIWIGRGKMCPLWVVHELNLPLYDDGVSVMMELLSSLNTSPIFIWKEFRYFYYTYPGQQ